MLTPARTSQVIGWVPALGATLIRAHYPLSPELQELADRNGILLWSEVPVYQVRSQYLSQRSWLTRAYAQLRTNILTNQNHPSVLLWSIGNELTTPPDGPEAAYIAGATALAHKLDPTRPVGMAVSSWPGVACQSAYAPLDVIGFNDYFGWFDAGGGTTDDRDALGPFLDFFHACYPTKPLFVSEFGFEGNRNGPGRRSAGPTASSRTRSPSTSACLPPSRGCRGRSTSPCRTSPPGRGGAAATRCPIHRSCRRACSTCRATSKPADSVSSAIYHATVQIAPAPARAQAKRGLRRGL